MSQSRTFGAQSRKSYVGLLLLTVCAFLTQSVLAAATSDAVYGETEAHKDNDYPSLIKRPAFFVGSRYGRSGGNGGGAGNTGAGSGVGPSKTRRLIIVPRNDRFFLGSRYGKRSDEYLSPYEQSSLSLDLNKAALRDSVENGMDNEKPGPSRTRLAPGTTMSCVYTGIGNFYRCSSADELNNILNRSEGLTMDSNSIGAEDANTK